MNKIAKVFPRHTNASPCRLTFLDLCAGIGGFSLGLEWAGMTCAGQVEIDPFCNRVLEKHWPHVPRWKDVKDEPRYHEFPAVDLVCGGYPCQPHSVAGKQLGEEDDRYLWPDVFRIVERLRPAWCLFENVAGHVKVGLDKVLLDLESAGYASQALVIPACAVGAWHQRDRVWIVAYSDRARELQPERRQQEQRERLGDFHRSPTDAGRQGLPSPRTVAAGAHWWQTRGMLAANDWWAAEPELDRVVHGLPGRVDRIRGQGNAVVPYLAYEIGRAIYFAHNTLY